jgi:hypothetical protein
MLIRMFHISTAAARALFHMLILSNSGQIQKWYYEIRHGCFSSVLYISLYTVSTSQPTRRWITSTVYTIPKYTATSGVRICWRRQNLCMYKIAIGVPALWNEYWTSFANTEADSKILWQLHYRVSTIKLVSTMKRTDFILFSWSKE